MVHWNHSRSVREALVRLVRLCDATLQCRMAALSGGDSVLVSQFVFWGNVLTPLGFLCTPLYGYLLDYPRYGLIFSSIAVNLLGMCTFASASIVRVVVLRCLSWRSPPHIDRSICMCNWWHFCFGRHGVGLPLRFCMRKKSATSRRVSFYLRCRFVARTFGLKWFGFVSGCTLTLCGIVSLIQIPMRAAVGESLFQISVHYVFLLAWTSSHV